VFAHDRNQHTSPAEITKAASFRQRYCLSNIDGATAQALDVLPATWLRI
jgi:hypothetical protein